MDEQEKVKYLTEEEQQELLEKYDPEAGTRKLTGLMGYIAYFGLLAFSLFQVYTAIFGVFTAQIQRTIHLGFALSLIFLLFPANRKKKEKGGRGGERKEKGGGREKKRGRRGKKEARGRGQGGIRRKR